MCARVVMQRVTNQDQGMYRKLQRRLPSAGVFELLCHCIRFYCALTNLII